MCQFPPFSHNSDLDNHKTSWCFKKKKKKTQSDSLASANNKHCSLHRFLQVDMKEKLAGWYRGLLNVSRSLHRLGKPPKCEGSLVSGDNTEFLLVIVYRQTGARGLDWKHPEVLTDHQPHWGEWGGWRIFFFFPLWGGSKQEGEVRCPTRNSPLISIQMLVRSKERLWPRPHHRNKGPSGSPWVRRFSSFKQAKWNSHESPWSSASRRWPQLYYQRAECTLEQEAMGEHSMSFHESSFCIKAFKYAD